MTRILKQDTIAELEQELSKMQDLTPRLQAIVALVSKSKLFHLKHSIARVRRAATKALAGNEINAETWTEINRRLDALLGREEHIH